MTTLIRTRNKFSRHRSLFITGIALVASSLIAGCVSVTLSTAKSKKASNVGFVTPSAPFKEISLSSADHAWQNPQNGNTVSFNSACNESSDPSIEAAKGDLLSGLEDAKVLDHREGIFDGRESETTSAVGNVDGVRTQVELLVFKKNNCIYSLSYVGVERNFSQNVAQYREFLQSFKAP